MYLSVFVLLLVMAMFHGMAEQNNDKLKTIADKSKLFVEFNQIFDSGLETYSQVS